MLEATNVSLITPFDATLKDIQDGFFRDCLK